MAKQIDLIECGEIVIRKTITKLNVALRKKIAQHSYKIGRADYGGYSEVYTLIGTRFCPELENSYIQAFYDQKSLYYRMKYPMLVAYNNFLGEILDGLSMGKPMNDSILGAKSTWKKRGPIEIYFNYQRDRQLPLDVMQAGVAAVKIAMEKRYNEDIEIDFLQDVYDERRLKEAKSAQLKAAKKAAKAETAKKVSSQLGGTKLNEKMFDKTEFYDKKVENAEIRAEEFNSDESRIVQLFDESGMPVFERGSNFVYADGSPCFTNVYDEERNVCIPVDDGVLEL